MNLNETKLDDKNKKEFEMYNYNILLKNRNRYGGGVALMIKKNLQYTNLEELNKLNREIIGAKIQLHNSTINVISFYLPPDNQKNKNRNQLSSEIFDTLEAFKSYVLVGDLNCHSKAWYCDKTTTKGNILNEYIMDYNLSVLNNRKHTHFCHTNNSSSVIDLMIVSNDLCDKVVRFKVHSNDMLSDHLPISSSFDLKTGHILNPNTIYINITNWSRFPENLDMELNQQSPTQTLEEEYSGFILAINKAKSAVTVTSTRKIDQLISYREAIWTKFCNSLDKTRKNSKEYWDKIKFIGQFEFKNKNRKLFLRYFSRL